MKGTGLDVGIAELQVVHNFTSATDLMELMNMKQLLLTSAETGATLALAVQGVARVPRPDAPDGGGSSQSSGGSVVLIMTTSGTVMVDGAQMSFVDGLPPALAQAGFKVRSLVLLLLLLLLLCMLVRHACMQLNVQMCL